MKKWITCFFLMGGFASTLFAQQLQPLQKELSALQPVNIFPLDPSNHFQFYNKSKSAQPAQMNVIIQAAVPIFSAEIFEASKSHYDIQAVWKSEAAVKKGDVLLARFAIRSIYAKQESGEAVVYFFVQGTPAFEKSVIVDISAGPEWKTIDIPFTALTDMNAGEAQICFSYAALAQKVEVTSIQVLNFQQKLDIAQLPVTKFTYAGREDQAAWRKDALKRIETIRTAPLLIQITDASGKPVRDAVVHAKLIQSSFIWGSAVNEALIANDKEDSKKYQQILKELFNTAVIENGLKWQRWAAGNDRRMETMKAFEWLQQTGFRQRAHNLVWPGWKFAPKIARETAEKDTAAFRKLIEDQAREKLHYTKDKVIAWDVINELVHEKDFLQFLPADIAVQWFKMAKQIDSSAQLFINEYGMLNSVASPKNCREYIALITQLRQSGAPIEGIGIQGHVGRQPRNPAQVISDLDLFKSIGLPVQITEFDINMTDEALQADYTRDFLIACYSHPVVTGFTIWGFWQGAHWKPDAAMFRKDWSAKPNAAVWREYVNNQWCTNITIHSDKKGNVITRGHMGKYEITASKNGKMVKVIYSLEKNSMPVKVIL